MGGNGLNCELKNGPTGCVDDRAQIQGRQPSRNGNAADAGPVSRSSGGDDRIVFNPSECKSIAEGGSGFFSFYKNLGTGRLQEFMDYCRRIEQGNESVEETAEESSEPVDRSGTWLCYRKDGNGPQYGVYEMINQPQFIRSSCRRVN